MFNYFEVHNHIQNYTCTTVLKTNISYASFKHVIMFLVKITF